ncbi:fatty acid desaturase family protein [Granulicoccus phenolivorans]|uniref:fatty acid desaturase family protein n=1 Tax=Granulicoccus phenolivorans TaxID=266854 RepID=UPI0004285F8B|nr:acyl-CoA desaturase [Granulicoccus phenolivorans]
MVTVSLEHSPTPAPASNRVDADAFTPQPRAFSEVSKDAKAAGLFQRTPWFYVTVGAAIAVVLAACITMFLVLGASWFQLIIAGVLGIVFTQIAFIGHEAGHRQVLRGGRANTRLARLLAGSVGLSFDWWNTKHSRHHANPNHVGKDPDIEIDTISFVTEDAVKARGIHRWITGRQGWLFFPLLTLEGLNLHFLSFKHLFSTKKMRKRHRYSELAMLFGRFALIAIPLFLLLPLGMAFAFLGVELAVFGIYMGAAFAPNHKGMPIVDGDARLDFFTKQVRTSRNIRGGWWATTLLGGLNYQVEHHLFPSMPRIHLAKARKLVRAKCAQLDVPYTEVSLGRSYATVIEYLNEVGRAARDRIAPALPAPVRS